MKTYETYKDSGVDWIDKVPAEWRIYRLKNIGKLSTSSVDKKIKEDEELINLINYMDVYKSKSKEINSNKGLMQVSASKNNIIASNLIIGDVLFTPSSETNDDIGHSIVITNELINTLYSYHVLRLRFFDNLEVGIHFKKYLFNNDLFLNQLSSKARGTTRMTLGLKDFYSSYIILPSLKEQSQITNYLDHKTQIIDTLIEKKEQLIKKLQAQRQAIINEAVTKGLNPNAKMKDSGIEWLGEIPEHWEVSRLDYMSEIIDPQPDHRAPKLDENGFPYLGIRDINPDGTINVETARSVELAAIEKQELSFTIQEGDIVFGKVGTLANPKHIKLGGNRIALSATLVLIKTESELYNEFLKYSLDSEFIWNQINTVIVGATRPALGIQQIRKFKIIKPSDGDMLEIVSFLKKQTGLINDLLKLNKKQIKKLKAYRQSIISEAVTGKIDLRDWQPKTKQS